MLRGWIIRLVRRKNIVETCIEIFRFNSYINYKDVLVTVILILLKVSWNKLIFFNESVETSTVSQIQAIEKVKFFAN